MNGSWIRREELQNSNDNTALQAVGISGVPSLTPMIGILHLLVCDRGTTEPIWRLSQADPNRPGYSRAEIDVFSQEKRIALFGEPMPVQPEDTAMYVHQTFESFFNKSCNMTFKQEIQGRLRWQTLDDLNAAVAVGSFDTLFALRNWAAGRLMPEVREQLSMVSHKVVENMAGTSTETRDVSFATFHDFLETARFSVDSVSREHYLEFLYWRGAAYLLQQREADVANLHEFLASNVTPACSRDDFYREVSFRKDRILAEAIASAKIRTMAESVVSEPTSQSHPQTFYWKTLASPESILFAQTLN